MRFQIKERKNAAKLLKNFDKKRATQTKGQFLLGHSPIFSAKKANILVRQKMHRRFCLVYTRAGKKLLKMRQKNRQHKKSELYTLSLSKKPSTFSKMFHVKHHAITAKIEKQRYAKASSSLLLRNVSRETLQSARW